MTKQELSELCRYRVRESPRTTLTRELHASLSAQAGPSTTERDKSHVDDQETQGEIVADEAAYTTSGGEYLIQPGDILLDGVCPLRENQG